MKFNRSKKFVAASITGAAAVLGGAAFAMWSSTGVGPGNAKALSAVNITVSAATGAADLYPGFTQGDVFFTSANTNPYPVTFTSMSPGTITSSDQTNCPASNLTVSTASGLSLLVPAGATATPGTIADVVTLASTAPNGCQGVVFTIALTLSGSQT